MKQDIKINKISYVMDFPTDTAELETAIENLHKTPMISYIANSYNSIVLVNAHDAENKHQYNYLMMIDENGIGFPINSLIYNSDGLSDDSETISSGSTSIDPKLKITNLDAQNYNHTITANSSLSLSDTVANLSSAVANIMNIFNNSGVQTSLGLNSGANSDAAQYIQRATASTSIALEQLEAVTGKNMIHETEFVEKQI